MSRNRICSIYYRASRADPQQYFSADIARPRRRGDRMSNCRGFITLLGGAAAWPMAARTQQSGSVRRIGVLMNASSDDADGQARVVAFVQALQDLGWTDRRNVRIDVRWGAGDAERYHRYAVELVALEPDVILAPTSGVLTTLQRTTRTIPIVFT